jgi:hypothetical protein
LGFFLFSQTRVTPPPASAAGSVDAWEPARSDLPWRITGRYQRFYQHLCSPRGFVPVGSVCSIDPVAPRLTPEEVDATARTLAGHGRSTSCPTCASTAATGLDAGTRATCWGTSSACSRLLTVWA